MMTVRKESPADKSYGRGSDNYRTPARYAVYNENGTRVGVVSGTRAGYMERSSWTVDWIGPDGMPRVVHYADNFKDAKTWAEKWDGQAPERWR